jgi:peptide/nickel transport system substrate-binding protein
LRVSEALKGRGLMRALFAVFAVSVVSVLVAACGSDSDSGSSQSGTPVEGGEITIAQTSQPDYLDPALSYTVNGWEPMWLVYTPLYTYRHEEGTAGAELIPGLAEELPEISEDGKTYTMTLRKGLTYSDGTPVKASDFERTIQRVLNLESGGAPFYESIVGAEDYESGNDPEADISGIKTDDKTGEISVELTEPRADFTNILAMNFAGLVPGDTPFENLTEDPPPGVGPYVLTESIPNRDFVMERRKDFSDLGIPDIPPGHIDKITTNIVKNQTQQAQDVLDNKLDYMQDPPPADIKPTVNEEVGPDGTQPQRYEEHTTSSTYYFFMNEQVPPFDDPEVRKAVNIGLDKVALAKLFAGEVQPGCSFLPPGMPGYDEALDIDECPYGNPNEAPDIDTARQMIEDAGAAGTKVTVWGNNDDPTDKVTQNYAAQLNDMGFDATPKIVDGGVYFQTIGDAKTAPQTGFANWFQDYPHPLNFYFLVDGATIQPTNNQNFGNVDDPKINDTLAQLEQEPDLQAVTDQWEDLDNYLINSGQIAAYGHRKLATFLSDRIDFDSAVFNPVYNNDYSSWQMLDTGE